MFSTSNNIVMNGQIVHSAGSLSNVTADEQYIFLSHVHMYADL